MRAVRPLVVAAAVVALLADCSSGGGGAGSTAPSTSASRLTSASVTSSAPSTPRSSAATSSHSTPPASASRTVSSTPAPNGPLIVLNPGHNGQDAAHPEIVNQLVPYNFHGGLKPCETTGTETNGGYPEHAFNWDVALRVRAILEAHGVRVAMTRPNDDGVGPCVDQRAKIGNQAGSVAVVSIHADGAPSGDHGFHVCYASDPPAGVAVDAASKRLSTLVHDSLARSSGLVPASYIGDGRGYFPRSDLGGLELATVPATFLEIGNMRNASDAVLQTSSAGRQQIASAVAAGILAFVGR